ncbi:hypothetical protein [Bradyrhizobium diazoefficiens]|uniref:hypothetical protein n=1 Tax=Bradyrhizobium diazoefficiens TaxID=1355477 RepID=UPI002714D1D8|nr:hypothetical protein [Bradyrhizobium diazoefficiens]WLA53954.1 hypothetical protein QIH81_25760 [Bradyrhizobium diazoefficiens]
MQGQIYPDCFGPYLRYAISTRFAYFSSFDQTISIEHRILFDEDTFKLFLLVEFKKAGQADEFADKMNAILAQPSVDLGPADEQIRFSTMRTLTAAVTPVDSDSSGYSIWQAVFSLWDKYVSRVELSLPLKLSAKEFDFAKEKKPEERWKEAGESPRSLLIGMLDDGCPFAAAQFLRTLQNGSASTRVRANWDQDQGRQPIAIGANTAFGKKLSDFKYGLEYRRHSEPAGGTPPQYIGLDEWIALHLTPAGSINEDSCYANAEFKRLARQQSHGAHVMDVLAGSVPTSSRIGPSKPGGDRRDPPSWAPGRPADDPACDTDVVFVQFPENCIRDATGVWLKSYVLDGIRYILSFADPNYTDHVIINLSYGPTTGPHDGTAELEAALIALVAEYNGTNRKPRLEILLPAGNAYLSEGHVAFVNEDEEPCEVQWTWRLPPDNTALCFAEIWMDNADAQDVSVTLTSPSGVVYTQAIAMPPPTGVDPPLAGVDVPFAWGGGTMWRLHVDHTNIAPNASAAESGDYTIKVDGIRENAQVDAYVARTDPNMGVQTGAKRSYFVDFNWEQTRSAAAGCTRVGGEFDKTGSLVHRDGTLNGVATAKKHRVRVAGGYILADGRKSAYSSAGPGRRGPRVGPDNVLPCDESHALEGIRAGGTRSGSVFRLTGTSTAAPQLGRQVVKLASGLPFPTPTDVPSPNDVVEIEKRGGGNIEPP